MTVGMQFKKQLASLLVKVSATHPHYVRCLKPNDTNEPKRFSRARVTEQLRYGGVLEAVRVARAGFPVRLPHADFFARYVAALSRAAATSASSSMRGAPRALRALAPDDARRWCKTLVMALLEDDHPDDERAQRRGSKAAAAAANGGAGEDGVLGSGGAKEQQKQQLAFDLMEAQLGLSKAQSTIPHTLNIGSPRVL